MIALTRKVAVGVCLGVGTLMLPGCRAPGSPVVRHERITPQEQEESAERRASVNQPNVPRDDVAPFPVAPEEPVDAAGEQIDGGSRGRETIKPHASEDAEPKQRKPAQQASARDDKGGEAPDAPSRRPGHEKSPDPADAESGSRRPSEGIDDSTVGSGTHEAPAHAGGDPQAAQRVDTAEDSDEESPIEPTSSSGATPDAAQELDEIPGAGNETVSASPVGDRRDDGDPNEGEADKVQRNTANGGALAPKGLAPSGPALAPVIPALVEKTASMAPEEIVYPEAPPPIAVTREQIDALRLPPTDLKRPIVGIWEQVGGDNSADFAEGNYTRTVLVIRTDGVLEVVRWFGAAREIRLDSKLNYSVTTGDHIRLELPRGSSGASRRAYSIPLSDGMSVRVDPIQAEFPTPLRFKQDHGELVIGGKTYRRVGPR